MELIEILKAIILGVVEGITEWLPISSTGHMILVDEFLHLNVSQSFKDLFLVVIQLGAILAVIVLYFKKLMPFSFDNGISIKNEAMSMWFKIIVSCIPAGIYGVFLDEKLSPIFYNYQTVSIMLILVGILFIIIENYNKGKKANIVSIPEITYKVAFLIGIFQLIAAIFPGTSRSGATILGALLIGVSRTVAAEFTFFLAIPTMLGASILKIYKFGINFTGYEVLLLVTGMVVAFIVSILAIKFLMEYIKKHDFKAFGWYRIILGTIVLLYFILIG